MTTTPTMRQSQPKRTPLLEKWAATMLLEAQAEMDIGQLTMHLPDGKTVTFGKGQKPYAEMTVTSPNFFRRLLLYGHIGFGEAYLDGEWDSPNIANVIAWFIVNYDKSPILEGASKKHVLFNALGLVNRLGHILRPNSVRKSKDNIADHYDLSNDFFKLFLDPSMTYSSGIYSDSITTLESAQHEKFKHMAQKLRLRPGDNVLEIGSGWGAFAMYMAREHGCHVTTITISNAQYTEAKARIEAAGLSSQITLLLKDYREMTGQFDKIVSIEMIEAVGEKYLDTYLQVCTKLLKRDGLLGLQMIISPDSRYSILRDNVDFIQKHIFPGTLLPSLARIKKGLNRAGDLHLFELEDIGLSYAITLRQWLINFEAKLDDVRALGFDERFIRKWRYYLEYCEAAFATRNITDVQAVYTRPNNPCLMPENLVDGGMHV
jgi:cyclopropane-fatty-acyl-phospholipid synthase